MHLNRLYPIILLAALFLPAQNAFSQVLINEYSCANLDQFLDNFGADEDWIELYNAGTTSVNIGGYHLSDNENKPTKWAIPAGTIILPKDHRIFWASGRDLANLSGMHTNFRLTQTKKNPETILFTDPNGSVLDAVKIKKTKLRQSRGRITDGAPEWAILTQPTPDLPNDNSPHFSAFADRPDINLPAGFYSDSIQITLLNNEPGALLYYTLDGTEPTDSATLYTSSFNLGSTAVLKAIAISPDSTMLPSFVEYGTYFINMPHTLPVVSIAGAQLRDLANGEKDLRPKGSIEYFDKNGQRKARAYGEFNSHGQDSWVNDQRSLDLIARDEMGYDNALDEKIFELSDRDEFQRLILRAAGDDNYPGNFLPVHKGAAHLRDAYVHNLAKRGDLHLDLRLSEKAIVYIDGQYWGVYDLRELPDDHDYTEYYYGQGKYEIQYLLTWGGTWAEYGGQKALNDWKALYNYIQSKPMEVQSNFDYVDSLLNVKSLVDYVLVNSLTVCSDWLNYNTGWWRGLNPAGQHRKWGYILWDNDATFGYYRNYTHIPDTSASAKPCNPEGLGNFSDPEGHIKVLNRLRANPGFEQYYISRYIDLMNTVFGCDNMLSYLDTVVKRIEPEMPRHTQRWGGTPAGWQKNVDRLQDFITRRCAALSAGMIDCYDLTGPYAVTFDVDPDSIAGLQINSLKVEDFPYIGTYFGGVDMNLEVLPTNAPAYKFDRWLTSSQILFPNDSVTSVRLDLSASDTIIAHFIPLSSSVAQPSGNALSPAIQAQPSVFQGATTVLLDLPKAAPVSLRLYTASGQEVVVLTDGARVMASGQYQFQLNLAGTGLPGGVYILHAVAGRFQQGLKLVYVP